MKFKNSALLSLGVILSVLMPSTLVLAQNQETFGCANFPDVNFSSIHCPAITYAKQKGVMMGNDDGTYLPYNVVTRAEAAAVLVRYMELDLPTTFPLLDEFPDADLSQWYAPYFEVLLQRKVFQGYNDGTMRPSGTLARSEWVKLWYVAQGLEVSDVVNTDVTDVPANADNDWFRFYLYDAVENGYLELQSGLYKPANGQKRNLIASLIYLFDENYQGVIHAPETSFELPTSLFASSQNLNFGLEDANKSPLMSSELGSGWDYPADFLGSHDGNSGTDVGALKKKF